MPRTVSIGRQDFEKMRANDNFYVDKTHFIKEWWGSDDDVTLITRPRRFGKTLNMSMTGQFFSVNYAGREDLFQGLSIWEDEKYRKLQGRYPVISLSFANVKEINYKNAVLRICDLLKRLYIEFYFLADSDGLTPPEKKYFRKCAEDMSETDAPMALNHLSRYLYQHYGKKAIIMLDEYDTPMQEAYINGYWEEITCFIRSLSNATFKTNTYLERALITGITRVSKESIFSDLNNLKVVTTTSDKYADSFGFTEEEVFRSLDEFGLSEHWEEVKRWYDGFTFGNLSDIYNPWSIINYLDTKKLGAYWANSSSNSLVSSLIRQGSKKVKQDFETFMRGEILELEIDEQVVYDRLSIQKNAIWSLLLASGYLRVIKTGFAEDKGHYQYELTLTNKEVQMMFEHMIRDWFAEKSEDDHNDFIKAFLLGDLEAMNDYINRIALSMFSYFDAGGDPARSEPERFYHGFVLGLMVDLKDRYLLTSNRESGFGRYDVMLEPLRPGDDGFILEFKVQQPRKEEGLQDTVGAALEQIEKQRYEEQLIAKGIPREKIRKYGFAFCGKKVLIGTR